MSLRTLPGVLRHLFRGTDTADLLGCTDRELLRRFAEERDESAFVALVCRHGPLVLGVCQRVLRRTADAEDAFQATFLALSRGAGPRPGAGGGPRAGGTMAPGPPPPRGSPAKRAAAATRPAPASRCRSSCRTPAAMRSAPSSTRNCVACRCATASRCYCVIGRG